FTPTTANAPVFPAILTNLTGAGRNVVFFDSNFQNPQIHQMDLTLERDLGWGTVVSVSYLGSLGRQLPNFTDINIAPAAQSITYPGVPGAGGAVGPLPVGATFTEPLFTARPNANFGSMTEIFSGTNSSYNAMVFQVSHRMSHNIQF